MRVQPTRPAEPGPASIRVFRRALNALPVGDTLTHQSWQGRHTWICWLLWAHVAALPIYGVVQGEPVDHAIMETLPVAGLALVAAVHRMGRRLRSLAATLGLVTCSALLVHFSGGVIEMHFHFFVVVIVVSLYQSWWPFLVALGVVLVHHGIAGSIDPDSVYNHPAALERPWLWALIHAGFIFAASVAALVAWRYNEDVLRREREAHEELAAAQQVAAVGSWAWDLQTDEVSWSEELHRMLQVDLTDTPTVELFLSRISPDDRQDAASLIETARASASPPDFECRIVLPDDSMRTIHVRGVFAHGKDGNAALMRGTCQDVTERKVLEHELEYRALYDGLTGLANRSLFMDRLEHAVDRRGRSKATVSVLYVDLDDFKSVNDRLGHRAGDQLLIETARRLRACSRSTDTVARIGGDEFAILLEDTDTDGARIIVDRLVTSLAEPTSPGHRELPRISASIGVADTRDAADSSQLLHHADLAMYEAKRRSGAACEIFGPRMADTASTPEAPAVGLRTQPVPISLH